MFAYAFHDTFQTREVIGISYVCMLQPRSATSDHTHVSVSTDVHIRRGCRQCSSSPKPYIQGNASRNKSNNAHNPLYRQDKDHENRLCRYQIPDGMSARRCAKYIGF